MPLLEVKGLTKRFPGVVALNKVDMTLDTGEVLCLVGENGAGKSTLIKCLAGVYKPDEGTILLNGVEQHYQRPLDALKAGMSFVYQEAKLIPNISVAENVYFGRFPESAPGVIDWQKLYSDTQKLFDDLQMHVNPRAKVSSLSPSQAQMVEITKAYSMGAQIMVLDEPSSAITDTELLNLFSIIRSLTAKGKSFIYISHRMKEIFEIGTHVMVLKDGSKTAEFPVSEVDMNTLVARMIGRELGHQFTPKDRPVKEELLRVEGLSNDIDKDCSFHIRAGEIVGFSGLVGSGRSELAESIFGYRKMTSGKIFIDGKEVSIHKPKDAIKNGIGFVTEDRKTTGLILNKSIALNTTIVILKSLCNGGVINRKKDLELVDKQIKLLAVKTPNREKAAGELSGGNQQKVILGKWLLTDSKILIIDEPTKGIDVGTKQEFYIILDRLARKGMAIMLISSELTEIIGLANRVYVMHEGSIIKELGENELTEDIISRHAMQVADEVLEAE